jgi:flagellar biosynthesis protein FliP
VVEAIGRGREPLRTFLIKHAHNEDRVLFVDLANRLNEDSDMRQKQTNNQSSLPQPEPASSTNASTPATATAQTDTADGAAATPIAGQASPADSAQSRSAPAGNGSRPAVSKDDFQIIIPSFVTSQLKEAFEIGFLIFIPFVIIDMVIANILLAMGMSMLSPSVISLPFKLLLFVLVDGWFLLVRGLVLSYV